MAQLAHELSVTRLSVVPVAPILPRWRVILWGTLLTALVGVIAGGYLAYVGNVTTSGYEILSLQAERDAWRTRNAQLRVEIGKARSLTWVEHEAVGRLRMQPASALLYLRVDDGPRDVAQPAPAADQRPAGGR
jgi:hypothetical protein